MNKLQKVLDTQTELQNRLGNNIKKMTEQQKTAYVKNNVFFVTEELHEMTRELPYVKEWKDYSQLSGEDIARRKELAQEEFIDVFTFLMNIALTLELTADEIYDLYFQKNKVNHERQDNGYVEGK
ncbi:dUTPase [bacterium]|nr:dUTPase [bacterium]